MPASVETPESANNIEEDKALIVAEMLLAEEMGDLTAVIIQNAAASIDLAKKTADLIAASKPVKDTATSGPAKSPDSSASIKADQITALFKGLAGGISEGFYDSLKESLKTKGDVPSPDRAAKSNIAQAWDQVKGLGLDKLPDAIERFVEATKNAYTAGAKPSDWKDALNKAFADSGVKKEPTSPPVPAAPPTVTDLSIFNSPEHEVPTTLSPPTPLPEGTPGAGTAGNPFPLPPPTPGEPGNPFPLPPPPEPGAAGNPFPLPGFEARSPTPPLPPPPPGSPATSFPALDSSTPALNKPQPVIVVGPKPLPVTVIGPIESTQKEKEPPEKKEKPGPDFLTIIADSLVGVLRGALAGNFGQAGSAIAQGTGKAVTEGAIAGGAAAGPAGAAGGAVAAVAEKLVGLITGPADAIRAKFEAVIGPAAILAATLNSTTAGFQVVAKVTTLLGVTLGAIFLPFTLALAVAMLEASQIISDVLDPSLDDLFGKIKDLIPLFETAGVALGLFASTVIKSATAILKAIEFINKANPFSDSFDPLIEASEKLGAGVDEVTAKLAVAAARAGAAARGGGGPGGGGPAEGIGAILGEFRRSFGTQASFSGIADVGKQIQLAALNKSPIDAMILKEVTKIAAAVDRAARGHIGAPEAPIGGRGGVRGPELGESVRGGGGDF